jgi:hypothetical protein
VLSPLPTAVWLRPQHCTVWSGSIAQVKKPPVILDGVRGVHELRRHREPHRPIAELPREVRSPALHPAVADQRARMLQAGAKLRDSPSR